MAERSSFSTDVKALLGALVTVAIILVAAYFGVNYLVTGQADTPSESDQPPMVAYQPSDAVSEDAVMQEDAVLQQEAIAEGAMGDDAAPAGADMVGADMVGADMAGGDAGPGAGQAEGGPGRGPGGPGGQGAPGGMDPDAMATAIAQGTEFPAGGPGAAGGMGRPGGQGAPSGMDPDAMATAVAQGTALPMGGPSAAGGIDPAARMTAIAQGTLMPGDRTSDNIIDDALAAAATPLPPVDASIESQTQPDMSASAEESASEEAVDSATMPTGNRLFGVARGSGATLYDEPDGSVVVDLAAGASVSGMARSLDGGWVLLQVADSTGWAPLNQLVMYGAENLPVFTGSLTTPPAMDMGGQAEGGEEAAEQPTASAKSAADTGPETAATQAAPTAPTTGPTTEQVYIKPIMATVDSKFNRLNVRSGPGTDFGIIDRLSPGSEVVAVARTADNEWVQLALPDSADGSGWVSASFVSLNDAIGELPAVDETPTAASLLLVPTPTPSVETNAPAKPQPTPTAIAPTPAAAPTESMTDAESPTDSESVEASPDEEVDSITLYTEPSAESEVVKVIQILPEGLGLLELERSDDGKWARITVLDPPGGVGWVDVAASGLDNDGPLADEEPVPDEDVDSITLYTEPSAESEVVKVIEILPEGLGLLELERNDDGTWARIAVLDSPGGVGWVDVAASGLDNDGPIAEEEPVPEDTEAGVAEPTNVAEPAAQAEALPDVTSEDERPASIPAIVVSEDTRLNIREEPNTDADIIVKVDPGDVLDAMAINLAGDWIQVAVPGEEGEIGWVAAEFIDLGDQAEMLEVIIPEVTIDRSEIPMIAASSETASQKDTDEQESLEPPKYLPVVGDSEQEVSVGELSGTLVFVAIGGGSIYGYNLETGSLWPITTGFDPAISPDGSTVAFTRDGGEKGLYLIDIDGSNERLIFSGNQRLASPKWSPDGQRIAFSFGYDSDMCYLIGQMCIPVDEWGEREVPDDVSLTTLVNYHIGVVDPNGQDYHEVSSLNYARTPDWNEAGIVYQSDAGLQRTADEHGAASVEILFDPLKPFYNDPDWQPGGGKIVYMGKEASHWELFNVNPDGSGTTPITRPATALVDEIPSNVSPAWSPDGKYIIFLSNRTDSGEAGVWQLWVMDADGGNQRPLGIDIPISYSFGDEQVVSWAQ